MLPCSMRLGQAFRNWYGPANARPQRARARAETHVGIIIDRSTSRYLGTSGLRRLLPLPRPGRLVVLPELGAGVAVDTQGYTQDYMLRLPARNRQFVGVCPTVPPKVEYYLVADLDPSRGLPPAPSGLASVLLNRQPPQLKSSTCQPASTQEKWSRAIRPLRFSVLYFLSESAPSPLL